MSWLGYLERMEEDRMPKIIFTQELEGTKNRMPKKDLHSRTGRDEIWDAQKDLHSRTGMDEE